MITNPLTSVFSRIKDIQSGLQNLADYSKPERVKEFETMLQSARETSPSDTSETDRTEGYHPFLRGAENSAGAAAKKSELSESTALEGVENKALSKALTIQDAVDKAAEKYGVSKDLIHAVIKVESAYDSNAVSHAGAQGLMQLMPKTARQMGVNDSFDIYQNVDGGTRYLKLMLDQYSGDLDKALAAYNAGPHRVDHYNGVPRIDETEQYVLKVKNNYFNR